MKTEVTQGQFESLMGFNPSEYQDCGSDCPVESVNWYEAVAYTHKLSVESGLLPCYEITDMWCREGGRGDTYSYCSEAGGIAEFDVEIFGVDSVYECEGYRLPTEAEWEYAARAGTTSAYHNGLDLDEEHKQCEVPYHLTNIAWYCGNLGLWGTEKEAQKEPNPWGLYDVSGNVFEMVWDSQDYSVNEVVDPEGVIPPNDDDYITARGGSWACAAVFVRTAYRNSMYTDYRYNDTGFRVVRTLNGTPCNR